MKVVLIDKQWKLKIVPPPSPTNPCLGTGHQDTSAPDLQYNIGMPVADIIRYLICSLGKQPYQVVNSGVASRTN